MSIDAALMPASARRDGIAWRPVATVHKWSPEQVAEVTAALGHEPSGDELALYYAPEELVCAGNLLTTAGLSRITALIIGGGGQAATATAARLGVGSSSTAEAVGQTDLVAATGATTRQWKVMDATYPQQAGGVMTFKSTFASAEGNFVWNEWGIDIGAPTVTDGTGAANAVLLNRKVAALGTKVAGAVWALTATITIA